MIRASDLCAAWLVWLVLTAGLAHAQTPQPGPYETAAARALFQEGVALARDGSYAAAVDRFERSSALHPSAATSFNLASSLVHLGRLVEANELLLAITRDPSVSPDLLHAAAEQRDAVAPRLARLTLRVEGATAGAEIALDARPLRPERLGVAIPTDPGVHEIVVRRGDVVVHREHVTLADGESQDHVLVVPAPDVRPVVVADLPPPTTTGDDAPPHGDDTGWIVFGVTIGVLVAGAVVTLIVIETAPQTPSPVSGNAMPAILTW